MSNMNRSLKTKSFGGIHITWFIYDTICFFNITSRYGMVRVFEDGVRNARRHDGELFR